MPNPQASRARERDHPCRTRRRARRPPRDVGVLRRPGPARPDPARVHHRLSTDAYRALGRPREKRDRAVAGSLDFGAYHRDTGEIAAYARAATDYATFARLCDVSADRPARGTGLGTALVTAARDHLEPYGLRRVMTATADVRAVYEKVGFTPLRNPDKWMALGQR